MEKLPMCRICLVRNVRMYILANTNLHKLYEKLTDIPFVTEDRRPVLACFFCCRKLKQCQQLMEKCLEAEQLFAQMQNEDYEPNPLINLDQLQFCGGFVKSPMYNISIVDVVQRESSAIKEELPAVGIEIKEEHQSGGLEMENLDKSSLDVADIPTHHSELDLDNDVPLMQFKTEVEGEQEVSKKKRKAGKMKRLELENLDKGCLDIVDITTHHSESDLDDDVPLMQFKTEVEGEQEVSKKKRKVWDRQRLELENLDKSCLDIVDITKHHSESDLDDDVPLMQFKTEVEGEQEVSKKKRKVWDRQRLEMENLDKSGLDVADIPTHHSELDLHDDVPLMQCKTEVEGEQVSKKKRKAGEMKRTHKDVEEKVVAETAPTMEYLVLVSPQTGRGGPSRRGGRGRQAGRAGYGSARPGPHNIEDFPRNAIRCSEWSTIIARDRKEEFFRPKKGSVVCSEHFHPTEMYTTTKGFRRLAKHAKPTLNISDDQNGNVDSSPHDDQTNKTQSILNMSDNQSGSDKSSDQDDQTSKTPPTIQNINTVDININPLLSSSAVSFVEGPNIDKQGKSPTSSLSIGSILDTPKKTVLKRRLNLCQKIIQKKNQQIDRLQKQNKRLIKKNISLKKALSMLKNRKGIDESLFTELSDNIEITETFNAMYLKNIKQKKRPFAKYPPGVRKFALTFHFYSPSAYKYVRRLFNTCLPHPNTLSNWYRSINAEPGFTAESFDRLKDKANNSNKKIIGSLVADEMSIRQQKIWTGKKYEGLVDMGMGTEDSAVMASQIYVIMFVAINDSFKIPLGYFLITSLTAETKANLLLIALRKCHQANTKVVSITFDGCKTNIATMKILGCNLDTRNKESMKTHFKHPCADYNVVVFLDACHMIKLMRNVFESQKIIKNGENAAIKWNYVTKLHQLQEAKQLHLANKLTNRHIEFKNEIMKVKLATQLLSRSVAKAIQFCESNLDMPEFKNSSPTSEFIMIMNNVFDILNTRNLRDHGLKKPLSLSNASEILAVIEKAKQYLISLNIDIRRKRTIKTNKESRVEFRTENVLLVKSQSNTGVLGLIVCLDSLKYLYATLIETKVMDFLLTYKTSQDHVELFFGNIRSQGGFNNNPNSRQVKSAYKKLLTHLELSSKFSGNAIPLDNIPILSGENNVNNLNHTSTGYRSEIEAEQDNADETDNIPNNLDDCDELSSNCDILSRELDTSTTTSDYIDQIVGYISGNVVRQILKKIKCEICSKSLLAKEKLPFHNLIDLRNMGGLFYSSKDVFHLCKKTEMTIRHYQCTATILNYSKILSTVLKSFVNTNILEDIIEHTLNFCNHRTILMRTIVQHYINIRFHYIAKKDSEKIKQKSKRQLYNKLTLFQGN